MKDTLVCVSCLLSSSYSPLLPPLSPPPPLHHVRPSALQTVERQDGVLQSRFSRSIGHVKFCQQDQEPLRFTATCSDLRFESGSEGSKPNRDVAYHQRIQLQPNLSIPTSEIRKPF